MRDVLTVLAVLLEPSKTAAARLPLVTPGTDCYQGLCQYPKAAASYTEGRVEVLLGSRFGHNRLNIGFNRISRLAVFRNAYKFLVSISSATQDEKTILQGMAAKRRGEHCVVIQKFVLS